MKNIQEFLIEVEMGKLEKICGIILGFVILFKLDSKNLTKNNKVEGFII